MPGILLLAAAGALPASAAGRPALSSVGPRPLTFEPNEGQADAAVRFLARGRGYGLFLAPTETVLVLAPPRSGVSAGRRPSPPAVPGASPTIVRMRLVGADATATITGLDRRPGRTHYLVGDRSRWRRDVPTFGRVRYSDVYPGISLLFYGTERELEYDFVVAPGADPGAIALAFDGAERLSIDEGGDLVLATAAGEVRFRRPVIYQEADGTRRPIDGGYVLENGGVRFHVAAWDASRPLVIDPVVGYSTFLGGSSNDQGFGIAIDGAGNAYVTGSTISSNFPVSATAVQADAAGVTEVFVTKLDPVGGALVYSTFLGGSGDEAGNAIAVDAAGNAFVTGTTNSLNFPLQGPFQDTQGGGNDAFVVKLDPTGSTLVYGTYLGSNTEDIGNGIALDSLGAAYVIGSTDSAQFPNNNAVTCLGTKSTGADVFVAKVSAAGDGVDYCRFIGGSGIDVGQGIAADAAGTTWVVGTTTSADLPVVNALQLGLAGNIDGFVGRLDPLGAVVYLTYLGGSGDDEAFAIAADSLGNAYVAGSTMSTNFPTASPILPLMGRRDAFVAKLDPAGSALVFSTFLGGTSDDIANAVAVHPTDFSVYLVGSTTSLNFPMVQPFQNLNAGRLDAFVLKLDPAGTSIVYSTYLGGTGDDVAQSVAVDADGVAFLTGLSNSPTLPAQSPPLQPPAGLLDAFVTQIAEGGILQFTVFTAAGFQVSETGGSAVISIQRTGDTSELATVDFATSDGTATAGADYTAVATTLTFLPGQIVASVNVPILDDNLPDGDETVVLTLSNPTGGAAVGARRVVNLTILDNEPAVSFAAASFDVKENQSPGVVTVNRSGPTTGTVLVDFSTGNGTATAPADYTTVTRTLTFAPGVRTQNVSVPVAQDTLAEGTETVALQLSNVRGGTPTAMLGVRSTAVLNINDEDVAGALQFSQAAYTVTEPTPGQVALATITVTRTGGSASGVTVAYEVNPGTAVAGTNYVATSGTLSFAAGQTSKTFTVQILNDGTSTGNLVANLALSNPMPSGLATLGSRATATLTIVDREPNVSFAASSFTVVEGTPSAVITVKRGGSTTSAFSVDYAASAGTAIPNVDFTPGGGTLAFAAGVITRTFVVPVLAPNDTLAGVNKTVALTLSNVVGLTCATSCIVPPNPATLTIVDNDLAGTIQFSQATYTVNEPAIGPINATITVTRTGGTASGVTVDYEVRSDGTAVPGTNYTATTPGTLTFAAGQTSKTFVVQILHDGVATGNLVVPLRLSNPRSAGGAPVSLGTRSTATLTIVDYEPVVTFAASAFAVTEGTAMATITVRRIGSAAVPFTVDFTTGDDSAVAGTDYQTVSGTMTFPAGTTSKAVLVPIINDTLVRGTRIVTLTLSNPSPAVRIVSPNPATLTIRENDVAGTVQFSQALYTLREPSGATVNATITVTRSGGAASGVTVDYAVTDNTAMAGTNYTATSGTLTFGAGQTTQTFTVPVLDDPSATGDLLAALTLSNPGGGAALGARSTATLKILDNGATVRLTASAYSVAEGSSAMLAVERSGPVGLPGTVVVRYVTSDGTGAAGTDYTATDRTLTFGPGVAKLTFSVPTIGNVRDEVNRTFNVAISVVGGTAGAVVVSPDTAAVTIVDNDVAGALAFFGSPYHSSEFDAIPISVRRASAAGPVTVNFTTVDGTAQAGIHYVAKSGTLTFPAGVYVVNFSITIIPNTLDDGDRTFNIELSNPTGGATLGDPSTATVIIADNDVGGAIQFALTTSSVSECATLLPCDAVLTVIRKGGGASGVSVDFATVDGTASAVSDYVATFGTVTFAANQLSQTIRIPLKTEPGPEPTKSFFVILSNPQGGGTLGPVPTATVNITDTR